MAAEKHAEATADIAKAIVRQGDIGEKGAALLQRGLGRLGLEISGLGVMRPCLTSRACWFRQHRTRGRLWAIFQICLFIQLLLSQMVVAIMSLSQRPLPRRGGFCRSPSDPSLTGVGGFEPLGSAGPRLHEIGIAQIAKTKASLNPRWTTTSSHAPTCSGSGLEPVAGEACRTKYGCRAPAHFGDMEYRCMSVPFTSARSARWLKPARRSRRRNNTRNVTLIGSAREWLSSSADHSVNGQGPWGFSRQETAPTAANHSKRD